MDDKENLLELTTDLVAAYVSNNTIEPDALPGLISSVYQALEQTMLEEETAEKPVPAVPIDQ